MLRVLHGTQLMKKSCNVSHAVQNSRLYGNYLKQSYDFFLVLDFEATCDRNVKLDPQEIIEFPCLKINGKTMIEEKTFHRYVKPRYSPVLSPFCVELTGILQEMVDDQPHFEECFEEFKSWLKQEKLLDSNFVFVTCGDWDFKVMLPSQCEMLGLEVPPYMKKWINIKRSFAEATGSYGRGLKSMLQKLNIEHKGRLHSGIDDCKNIASILRKLAERHQLKINAEISSQ